ncbi:hypothetical protein XENTR_v10001782 [Xenopus tropicalis]|eukprot:NP_001011246.1 annexin A1 gene 3 [Xenopus tropicalis]
MDQQSNTSIVHQMLQVCQQTQISSTQQQQQQSGGSGAKPHPPLPKYDASDDVRALEKALKPKEVDEGTIIDILTKRNNDQRQEIKAAYEKVTKKPLAEALKAALSGDLEEILLAMLKTPPQFDADEMKQATKGLGTDEDCIIEIMASRTNQQIKKMQEAYEKEYKTSLEKDIKADTSGDFQKALLMLLKAERNEDSYVNEDLAEADAKALYEAGEKIKKADVSIFIDIFCSRSSSHLKRVAQKYVKYSSHNLNEALDLEMKGDIESLMIAILKCAVNTPKYFAEKLNLAMKGPGVREKALNRIMVSRAEKDMKEIKAEYKTLYDISLRKALMDETKGDYQTVLIALCGHD